SMRGKPFRLIREKAKKTLTHPKKAKVQVVKTLKKGAFKVVFVDGATVRANLDPYFLLGGHHLVYPYVPKGEIWVDDRQDPKELKYTILHEVDEHERMAKGMTYDDAHDFALATERMHRRKDGVADFVRG
ncbi:hypothetical protein L0Y59_01060, partial [Candidatus Uhrbacteria bacterium]|nr:hypothetical protein [Candidatus Uhrbacteria bacterium]